MRCSSARCCTRYDAWRRAAADARGALVLAVGVTLQAGLGIVTLLHPAPLALALSHQMLAIVVLTVSHRTCRAAVAARASSRMFSVAERSA